MTEIGPNPAEFRAGLRDKLAQMPPVGTQGREIRPSTEEPTGQPVDPPAALAPVQAGMRPNPAQGASTGRAPVATQATSADPLTRIREKSSDIADMHFDPTL